MQPQFDTGTDWWEVISVSIGIAVFVGGIIAIIIRLWIKGSLIPQVKEAIEPVRHAVSDNHHSSETPTLVDRMDTIQRDLSELRTTEHRHHWQMLDKTDDQDKRMGRLYGEFRSTITKLSKRIDDHFQQGDEQ